MCVCVCVCVCVYGIDFKNGIEPFLGNLCFA